MAHTKNTTCSTAGGGKNLATFLGKAAKTTKALEKKAHQLRRQRPSKNFLTPTSLKDVQGKSKRRKPFALVNPTPGFFETSPRNCLKKEERP